MKLSSSISFSVFVSICAILICQPPVFADNTTGYPPESPDRVLSPYFHIQSDEPELDKMPLLGTSVEARIAGVIADVTVVQEYKNEGTRPIEAIYVFPASTRAAVYGMKMTIGERTIVARIEERKKAREEYEAAKKAGKSASLLEEERPNVFRMNVANILPNDHIHVEMQYTELLVPTEGVYEFVYPTVVGPRYSTLKESDAKDSEDWVKNPYLHEGEAPAYTFSMEVTLSCGLPIREISCPSHAVNVDYESKSTAAIRTKESEKQGGNRDFILKYRLSGDKIESGLLLYAGEKENFFLLMVQPPEGVSQEIIPPREYIFIVDVSGSMNGFPLDISKELMRNLLSSLRPVDTFNLLLFAGSSHLMSERCLPATSENIQEAIRLMERQRGGGGTEILPALKRALSLPKGENASRSIVVVTDGYVRVETEVFDLIRSNLGEANMFAFGIGTSVNRYLIEGMARVGMGEPFVVTEKSNARAKAETFETYIRSPVLTNIEKAFSGFSAYDVEPLSVPDVLAQRPVIVYGKWRGKPEGRITLTGVSGKGKQFRFETRVQEVAPEKAHFGLKYLWARKRIALISDYNTIDHDRERVEEITSLGLKYNLLTPYTSFVAIDTIVRTDGEKTVTVKQPLPLPQGVSDLAVGASAPGGLARSPGVAYRKNARSFAQAESMPAPAPEKQADAAKPRSGPLEKESIQNLQVVGIFKSQDELKAMVADKTGVGYVVKKGMVLGKEGAKISLITEDTVVAEISTSKGMTRKIVLKLKKPRVDYDKESIKTAPNLDKDQIALLMADAVSDLESCYAKVLKDNGDISGSAKMRIELSPYNEVDVLLVDSETINSRELEACLLNAARQWEFPEKADKSPAWMECTFRFSY